jgi:hypothetical protein
MPIELVGGTRLSLSARAAKGSGLVPTLRLLAPDGGELAADTAEAGSARPSARLRRVEIPEQGGGTWFVALEGDDGTTGDVVLRMRGRHPHRTAVRGRSVRGGDVTTIAFTGLPRSRLTARLRPLEGFIESVRVLDPRGAPVDIGRPRSPGRGYRLTLDRVALRGGLGRYTMEVTAGDADLVLDADLRVSGRRLRLRSAAQLVVPEGFAFSTIRPVALSVDVNRDDGSGLPGVRVDVLGEDDELIASGITDELGEWEQLLTVASKERLLQMRVHTIGLAAEKVVRVADAMHVVFE